MNNLNSKSPKIYYDADADLQIIKSQKVLIIGYGNQGRAHSKNLFDSGVDVIVGLRENSTSFNKVEKDKLIAKNISSAIGEVDIISLLVPDQVMDKVFNESVFPYLRENQTILFSHGYNILYEKIKPPKNVNVVMVAPSGAGIMVRDAYKKGGGVPNLIAIHQDCTDNSLDIALSYSKAIGGTKAGAFLSSFAEETESDLFGEQVVLCGGIPSLIQTAFNVLVEEGFQPIVAWYVCFYEVKLIVDVFHEKGFQHMYKAISETAEYGSLKIGNRLINDSVKAEMKNILKEIKSKEFYNELEEDAQNNFLKLSQMRQNKLKSLFEQTTEQINSN